jgi:carbon monoxide dehydrogenase subunit G
MKKFLAGLLVSAVAIGAVVGIQQVSAQSAAVAEERFSGTFRVSGKDTDGTAYVDGVVRVTKYGDGFKVIWAGSRIVRGIANFIGSTLAVAYHSEGVTGVAIYLTKDDGYTFDGYWQDETNPKEGQERLVYIPGT